MAASPTSPWPLLVTKHPRQGSSIPGKANTPTLLPTSLQTPSDPGIQSQNLFSLFSKCSFENTVPRVERAPASAGTNQFWPDWPLHCSQCCVPGGSLYRWLGQVGLGLGSPLSSFIMLPTCCCQLDQVTKPSVHAELGFLPSPKQSAQSLDVQPVPPTDFTLQTSLTSS